MKAVTYTHFVTPDGSSTSFCTQGEPCSLSRAVALVGSSSMRPGSLVLVQYGADGVYSQGALTFKGSGTADRADQVHRRRRRAPHRHALQARAGPLDPGPEPAVHVSASNSDEESDLPRRRSRAATAGADVAADPRRRPVPVRAVAGPALRARVSDSLHAADFDQSGRGPALHPLERPAEQQGLRAHVPRQARQPMPTTSICRRPGGDPHHAGADGGARDVLALRTRHPEKRLFAIFEPRTATACRSTHQKAYAESFDAASEVLLAPLGRVIPEAERLDTSSSQKSFDSATSPRKFRERGGDRRGRRGQGQARRRDRALVERRVRWHPAEARRGAEELKPRRLPRRTRETDQVACVCGKGESLESCCGPYLKGEAQPATAEALMRARYAAYALGTLTTS